ncbi:MAG TPA: lactonase family protein [Rariglobus sp.]
MIASPAPAHELLVYVGTYTRTTSKGIYVGRFDPATGKLAPLTVAAEMTNPSFLAVSSDRRHLYAVSEGAGVEFNGQPSGVVNAFALAPADGRLTLINAQPSAGKAPCHIATTPDDQAVLVANYGSGTVSLLPVRADGGLDAPSSVDQHEGRGVHPDRQKHPFAHSINPSADGRFAYAADLGTDEIYIYRVNTAAGTLAAAEPASVRLAPGSGPRHLALSSDARRAYVINELANALTTFAVDTRTGVLTALQTVPTLPADFTGANTTAEVAVHPNGRFLYGSNRGHDSIVVFKVDPSEGTLTLVEHVSTQGRNPRHFAIDPGGRWLIAANQDGNSLVVFAVDIETGRLTPTGQTIELGTPVCVRFY